MAIEIERKFLVNHEAWSAHRKEAPLYLRQGYLFKDLYKTARVRISDDTGYLTIKGKTVGISRAEYEFEIPKQDAEELLTQFCDAVVSKHRHLIPWEGKTWEVDVFLEDNAGLIVAEIELTQEDESFALPPFVSEEVTSEHRYANSQLAMNPYKNWRI